MPKNPARNAAPADSSCLFRLTAALLEAFKTNNRINQYLVDNLPPAAWTAKPEQLNRSTVTPAQAVGALDASLKALSIVVNRALETDGRIKGFRPTSPDFLAT